MSLQAMDAVVSSALFGRDPSPSDEVRDDDLVRLWGGDNTVSQSALEA
jgi:hypothetical protein